MMINKQLLGAALVGLENVAGFLSGGILEWDGAGLPLARTEQIGVLEALWQRVQEEIDAANAFSLRDLKIDGNDLMRELGVPQGREIGRILDALFERVTDEPALNTRDALLALAKAELGKRDPM